MKMAIKNFKMHLGAIFSKVVPLFLNEKKIKGKNSIVNKKNQNGIHKKLKIFEEFFLRKDVWFNLQLLKVEF